MRILAVVPLVPVCLLLLRECGRLPEEKRENLVHSILSIAPTDNETIMRVILGKVPLKKVFHWILENTEIDS